MVFKQYLRSPLLYTYLYIYLLFCCKRHRSVVAWNNVFISQSTTAILQLMCWYIMSCGFHCVVDRCLSSFCLNMDMFLQFLTSKGSSFQVSVALTVKKFFLIWVLVLGVISLGGSADCLVLLEAVSLAFWNHWSLCMSSSLFNILYVFIKSYLVLVLRDCIPNSLS